MIAAFRVAFALALSAVTWLAFTSSELPSPMYIWDKGNHFVAFFVLAFLLDYSFPAPARRLARHNAVKWAFLMGYGVGIEVVQWYLGYRQFDFADMLGDALGIASYVVLLPLTQWLPVLAELRPHDKDQAP